MRVNGWGNITLLHRAKVISQNLTKHFDFWKSLCKDNLKLLGNSGMFFQANHSLSTFRFIQRILIQEARYPLQLLFWFFWVILGLLMCLLILFIVIFQYLLDTDLSVVSWILLNIFKNEAAFNSSLPCKIWLFHIWVSLELQG